MSAMHLSSKAADLDTELCHVLWACHHYWQGESRPLDQRSICYRWVRKPYEERFSESFHQSRAGPLGEAWVLSKGRHCTRWQ